MFTAIALIMVVVGTFAIFYTVIGAVSGRSLTIGLILAGCILTLQVFSLVYGVVTSPPPASKPAASSSAEPSASPDASALLMLGTA